MIECPASPVRGPGTIRHTDMLASRREPEMTDNIIQFETRLARLESDTKHMASDIIEIKVEVRDLRTAMDAKFEAVNGRFEAVNGKFDDVHKKFDALSATMNANHTQMIEKIGELKVWALTGLGGGLGFGLLSVLARTLHWI